MSTGLSPLPQGLDESGVAQDAEPGPLVTLSTPWGPFVVDWGHPWQVGTAAYWIARAQASPAAPASYPLGRTLAEEVAAGILGGFGRQSSVGLAAFSTLRDLGLLEGCPDARTIEDRLRHPLHVHGAAVRYRFPTQRSARVADALRFVASGYPPRDGRRLRDWLLGAPGVGLTTASWIARSWTGTNGVAIVDIHIQRAGTTAGVFSPAWSIHRDYARYEDHFLAWAETGGVDAASLDACIWAELARGH